MHTVRQYSDSNGLCLERITKTTNCKLYVQTLPQETYRIRHFDEDLSTNINTLLLTQQHFQHLHIRQLTHSYFLT